MEKLNQLLNGNIIDFAAVFSASTRELPWVGEDSDPRHPLWLEGSLAAARAGYALGEGEFIHHGEPRRFHFSGLPLRQSAGTRVSASGTVLRLRRLSDFSGSYLACDALPSKPPGCSRLRLKNEHGVVIELMATPEDRVVDLPYSCLRVRL